MALISQPTNTKPAAGYPGMWQNMEECNSFTAFASEEMGFAVPVTFEPGATDSEAGMGVEVLTVGSVFQGITLSNIYTSGTPTSAGDEMYGIGDILGVADEGVLFVKAGSSVAKGNPVFWDPATGLYHGSTATGRIKLPNTQFDAAGAANDAVALKIRLVPGGAAVTAEA